MSVLYSVFNPIHTWQWNTKKKCLWIPTYLSRWFHTVVDNLQCTWHTEDDDDGWERKNGVERAKKNNKSNLHYKFFSSSLFCRIEKILSAESNLWPGKLNLFIYENLKRVLEYNFVTGSCVGYIFIENLFTFQR